MLLRIQILQPTSFLQPSSRAISRGIQNDSVFLAPIGMHPITSLPAYNARVVLTWYQQGHFLKFSCTRFWISWTVHSWGLAVLRLGILVEDSVDDVLIVCRFSGLGKTVLVTKMWHARVVWPHCAGWDPTLGLINDLQAACTTFLAASLSRAWVLSFVYLFSPINDHIIRFAIPLIVCRGSLSDMSGWF